jgi:hypothetical protein
MDRTRTEEIIAAYGADAARWPADERAAAQALVAADPALEAQLAAAAALDRELAIWARTQVATGDVAATAAADAALASLPPRRGWFPTAVLGGSIAASLLAAVILLPSGAGDGAVPPTQVAQGTTTPVQTAQVEQDVQLWGTVFTLTPEEESLI